MLFSLKRQRHNRQNTLAVDPAEGKTGKRLYFHRTVEMRQPHAMTGPRRKKPPFVVGSQRGPPYMGELRCRLILKSGGYGFPLIRAHRRASASARRSFLHNIRHVAAYAYGGGPEGRSWGSAALSWEGFANIVKPSPSAGLLFFVHGTWRITV